MAGRGKPHSLCLHGAEREALVAELPEYVIMKWDKPCKGKGLRAVRGSDLAQGSGRFFSGSDT